MNTPWFLTAVCARTRTGPCRTRLWGAFPSEYDALIYLESDAAFISEGGSYDHAVVEAIPLEGPHAVVEQASWFRFERHAEPGTLHTRTEIVQCPPPTEVASRLRFAFE